MNEHTIFLADDHGIMREGLRHILNSVRGCRVIGEAGDGQDAYQQIEETRPHIAVLDISMPGMTGIEIARRLRRYHPEIKIIMLSRHDNEEYIDQLLKYKVDAYVLKDDAGEDLIRAVEAVIKNENYLSPRITGKVMQDYGRRNRSAAPEVSGQFTRLTNREREILKLIAEGNSNDEIAKILWISPRTAKVHRANIMKKLDVHKVTDLVKYAIKAGLIET